MAGKEKIRRWLVIILTISFLSLANSDTSSSSAAAKDEVSPSDFSTSNIRSSPESISEMGSLIPGVYKEYLPQPIFYESVVPALFQYMTPTWNKSEVTFNNWYQCVSETVPYRYSCPVTFHMNKAIVNLHVDFEGLHPISDVRTQSLQNSMKDYYSRLTSHSLFCDTIQRHFAGVWTESSELERYINALQGCSRGSQLHPFLDRSLQDYNYSIRQLFTKMENNFYNTFYKNILGSGGKNGSMDLVASALLSNTRTSLQGTILGQYYAEKNRWVHANQDCRQQIIPTSLITPEKFNQTLSLILKMSVFSQDIDLSVAPGHMSKYYTLPLADCTHTADSFVVRVLIPILKKLRGQVFQLVHVHTIPFIYKDHICRVKLPQAGNEDDQGSVFLYNEFTHHAYRTKCKPNELCKISQYILDKRRSDPCASALLSRNDSDIRKYCDFECLPKSEYILPSVVQIANNQFVLTGNSLSFQVVCGRLSEKEKLFYVNPDQFGALLVKLPCHCRLIIPQFNVFSSGQACEEGSHDQIESNQDIEVTPIIPFMFGKVKEKETYQVHDESYFDNLAEGSLLNLTDVLDPQRINNYIRSSQTRREIAKNQFKGMDFYAEKLQSGESLEEHGGSGVGGAFWTIFIMSVILVVALQLYIIVMFQRQQRISYSKEDRILYRVEPDDATSLG